MDLQRLCWMIYNIFSQPLLWLNEWINYLWLLNVKWSLFLLQRYLVFPEPNRPHPHCRPTHSSFFKADPSPRLLLHHLIYFSMALSWPDSQEGFGKQKHLILPLISGVWEHHFQLDSSSDDAKWCWRVNHNLSNNSLLTSSQWAASAPVSVYSSGIPTKQWALPSVWLQQLLRVKKTMAADVHEPLEETKVQQNIPAAPTPNWPDVAANRRFRWEDKTNHVC